MDLTKAYALVRKEELNNILNEFYFPLELVKLIVMSLNETLRKILTGK
jgi:hypothetical protein